MDRASIVYWDHNRQECDGVSVHGIWLFLCLAFGAECASLFAGAAPERMAPKLFLSRADPVAVQTYQRQDGLSHHLRKCSNGHAVRHPFFGQAQALSWNLSYQCRGGVAIAGAGLWGVRARRPLSWA